MSVQVQDKVKLDSHSREREAYYSDLRPLHLAPLWNVLSGLVPNEPQPAAVPWKWAWNDVYPQLVRAGSLITAEEAERRVLVLENPKMAGLSRATDTLYAGLQMILPGEVAPAHRHTQSALRFVLHGEGAFTAVDGEKTMMSRGDFIITPHWTWHDHGHIGDEPMVWMDGLDVALVDFLRAGFREGHPEEKSQQLHRSDGHSLAKFGTGLLPVNWEHKGSTSPVFNYPYARSREALEILNNSSEMDPHFGIWMRYINPINGDWAMPTLGTSLRLVPRGFTAKKYRSVDSVVLVCVEGSVSLSVEGSPSLELSMNDVAVVPGWRWWSVTAARENAVLFSFSDRPTLEKLGLFREERAKHPN
jgi:gentisate 1,2-dioxygenase